MSATASDTLPCPALDAPIANANVSITEAIDFIEAALSVDTPAEDCTLLLTARHHVRNARAVLDILLMSRRPELTASASPPSCSLAGTSGEKQTGTSPEASDLHGIVAGSPLGVP